MAKEEILILKVKLEADPKTVKTQQDLIDRNKEILKLLRQVPREGEEGFGELQQAAEKARQEYIRNRQEIQRFNKSLRETQKAVPTDSLKGMSQRLKELEKEYRELSKEQRDAFGPKLQKEILATRNALKEAEAGIGDFRRNVGNYEKSIDKAIKKNRLFNKSFRSMRDVTRAAFGGGFFGSLAAGATSFFDEIIEGARDSNPAIGRIADSLDGAKESLSGVIESTLSFISAPLSGLLNGFSALADSVSAFIDPLGSARAALIEQADVIAELETEFVPLLDRYDELTAKTQLSTEEQEELDNIVKDVTKTLPTAATEFNEYGEAIAISTDAGREFVAMQQRIAEARNRDLIEAEKNEIIALEAQLVRLTEARGKDIGNISEQGRAAAEVAKRNEALLSTNTNVVQLFGNIASSTVGAISDLTKSEEELAEQTDETNKQLDEQIARLANQIQGSRDLVKELEGGNIQAAKAAGSFSQLQTQLNEASTALKNQITNQQDYSKELNNFLSIQEEVNRVEDVFSRLSADRLTSVEALAMAETELIKEIQNLAVQQRESSAQEEKLIEIRLKQARATEALDRVNNALLSTFEKQKARQSELQNEIQQLIADGQPYQTQLAELTILTEKIVAQTREYTEATKDLGKETEEITRGSMADYERQIKEIESSQEGLSIKSEEYAGKVAEINRLETERSRILELLSLSLEELTRAQTQAIDSLLDEAAVSQALQKAQEQLQAVEGLTQESADKRKAIEEQLQKDIASIRRAALERRIQEINGEITRLQQQRDKELGIEGQTEEAKAKIRADFGAQISGLTTEQNKLQNDLLQEDIENFQNAEDEKVKAAKEAGQKIRDGRAEVIKNLFALGTQAISGFSNIVAQTNELNAKNEKDQLQRSQEQRLEELERTGATEQQKQDLLEKFEEEKRQQEKKAAQQRKKTAITESIINTAVSVAKTYANLGLPFGVPAAILAGVLGAAQTAIIAGQKFGRGGIPKGRRHAQGGIPAVVGGSRLVEIEDQEPIVNRNSGFRYRSLLSAINQAEGGVSFDGNQYGAGLFAGLDNLEYSIFSKNFDPGTMMATATGVPQAELGAIFRGPSMPVMAERRAMKWKYQDGGLALVEAQRQAENVQNTNFGLPPDQLKKIFTEAINDSNASVARSADEAARRENQQLNGSL